MPTLSKRFVESEIEYPTSGQVIFRDDKLPGFALRVTRGCKSYIVESRVNGVNRRITIGKHGTWTAEAARKRARELLAEMSAGRDPRRQKAPSVTLREVLDKYLGSRKLRPNSVRNYTHMLRRCLGDWLDKPVTSISKDMVETRHRDLTRVTRQGTSGQIQANMTMRILGTLLNFAAANYEASNGQPIIQVNPVRRLSQNKAWHREYRRQVIIPDTKLADWYHAVISLKQATVRDYLLVLLLTGLRRNEAATLRWSDIDLESRVLTVRDYTSKNYREHRLPLSEFLCSLFIRRKQQSSNSIYVFPGQGGRHHIADSGHVISHVLTQSGCSFTLHDLRRTFLTAAARLDLPHYIIKKLANHVSGNDVTLGYIIVDVERLREPMERINEYFLDLFRRNPDELTPQ